MDLGPLGLRTGALVELNRLFLDGGSGVELGYLFRRLADLPEFGGSP